MQEEELLLRAGPFSNARCFAHYVIAMKSLALGEREKARKHFEETAATGKLVWYNYHWAKAFLHRMNEDPKWPDWIPAKPSK
jgi:hypothetical protein